MPRHRARRDKRIRRIKRESVRLTLAALVNFRARCVIHGKRLFVLKELAGLRLPCCCPELYEVMRLQAKYSRRDWPSTSPCFVCERLTTIVHHVIQIQHGGADIDRNKVPLCEDHHADVHPWLPADTPGESNLWVNVVSAPKTVVRKRYKRVQWVMPPLHPRLAQPSVKPALVP